MVWNHWEHRNEPSTRLEGMLPDPTANLGYAIQSLSTMGPAQDGLKELQTASGNAYSEEVRGEIDRRTMMRIEQDFKKWLAGSLEGANTKSNAPDADKRYQRPCKVMNIKNTGEKGFMNPYDLAERNHTNWGTADLMSLPGVAEYIKENDRKETESKLSDALLHDPSSGRLKDLSSAWEYFIKFVVQQPDIFAAGIDFNDASFPSDDFHPGNWGPRFETSVMPGINGGPNQRVARNSFTNASGTASSTRDPQPDVQNPSQGPFGRPTPDPPDPPDAEGTISTPATGRGQGANPRLGEFPQPRDLFGLTSPGMEGIRAYDSSDSSGGGSPPGGLGGWGAGGSLAESLGFASPRTAIDAPFDAPFDLENQMPDPNSPFGKELQELSVDIMIAQAELQEELEYQQDRQLQEELEYQQDRNPGLTSESGSGARSDQAPEVRLTSELQRQARREELAAQARRENWPGGVRSIPSMDSTPRSGVSSSTPITRPPPSDYPWSESAERWRSENSPLARSVQFDLGDSPVSIGPQFGNSSPMSALSESEQLAGYSPMRDLPFASPYSPQVMDQMARQERQRARQVAIALERARQNNPNNPRSIGGRRKRKPTKRYTPPP